MSAWWGTGALALWMDIEADSQGEADDWYVHEHLPERVAQAGYRRARRYVALNGGPRYLSLFEARTPEDLASEGYLGLVGRISEQSARLRSRFRGVMRNTFSVPFSQGSAPGLGGCIASLRLASLADGGSAAPEGLQPLLRELARAPGVLGVHWLRAAPEVRRRMDAGRVTGHDDRFVDHAQLVETTQAHEAERVRAALLTPARVQAAGWREEGFGIYQLLYAVSAADMEASST
jgi:hypothetical protein